MTHRRTVIEVEAPPGWTITHQRRPINHRHLTAAVVLTVIDVAGLVVATHAGLVPPVVTGMVLGVIAGGWHLYLTQPVHVTHATPPTRTKKGAPDVDYDHEPATAASR